MADITASPLLKIESLDVHYGAIQALYDVSVELHAGTVVSILGGNASGKSTTLKSVLGLVKPSRGRVILDGQEIQGRSPADVIDLGVASIPEGRRVFPEMTVHENLLMGAYPRRHRPDDIKHDLQALFEAFPRLAERRAQLAGTLSGGEQQMLALGRAWLRRGRLICIDEPSMGLSPRFVDAVYEVLFRWKSEGQTILLVEQNARIALELADYGYVLQHGHVVLQGPANELAADPAVQKAYLGAT